VTRLFVKIEIYIFFFFLIIKYIYLCPKLNNLIMLNRIKNIEKFLIILFFMFTTVDSFCQDPDGPPTPPGGAPIDSWIPFVLFGVVSLGFLFFLKRKVKLIK